MKFDTDNAGESMKKGWGSFKKSMKLFGESTVDACKKVAPTSMSDDKSYAKGLCLMSALMVMADTEVNDDEVGIVADIFDTNLQCREYLGTDACHDTYLEALSELAYVQENPVLFISTQNAVLSEIKNLVPAANAEEFIGLAEQIAKAGGDLKDPESAMIEKLKTACA